MKRIYFVIFRSLHHWHKGNLCPVFNTHEAEWTSQRFGDSGYIQALGSILRRLLIHTVLTTELMVSGKLFTPAATYQRERPPSAAAYDSFLWPSNYAFCRQECFKLAVDEHLLLQFIFLTVWFVCLYCKQVWKHWNFNVNCSISHVFISRHAATKNK